MTFAYIENNEVKKISSSDAVEWGGFTIQNVRLLTPAERKERGIFDFVPAASVPAFHRGGQTTYQVDTLAGTVTETVEAIPFTAEEVEAEKVKLCQQVDTEADAARLKIAGDPLRVVEYERAATEAQAFKDAGYTGATPPTLASWAEANNWTAQQAADDILAVSAAWNYALYALRDIRLKGKEAIKAAADAETATAAATAASDQIKAILAAMGL